MARQRPCSGSAWDAGPVDEQVETPGAPVDGRRWACRASLTAWVTLLGLMAGSLGLGWGIAYLIASAGL